MTLRSQVVPELKEMIFAPPATYVLHASMPDKKEDNRNFHFVHHTVRRQQLLSCMTMVYISMHLWVTYSIVLGAPLGSDRYAGVSSSLTAKSLCPVCASALQYFSRIFTPVYGILHGRTSFCPGSGPPQARQAKLLYLVNSLPPAL